MYANGQVPLSALIHVQNNIWLPAGTLARWSWAVGQGVAKYGARLRITGQNSSAWNTWNGYRPLSAQKLYRSAYGNLAAQEGKSSHGGTYGGREVFAIDVENWRDLAPGNETLAWARFVALMRLAGLTVDFVTPREQWHVGDMNNPWAVPAFASGGGGSHINPAPPVPIIEEEEMYLYYQTQAPITTWILWIPGLAKYQTTRDGEQALRWRALVGKDARELTSAQVLELQNVAGIFN